MKKDAGGFDLPIALGLLLGSGQVAFERSGRFAVVGELALTGETRPIKGVLAMALAAFFAGRLMSQFRFIRLGRWCGSGGRGLAQAARRDVFLAEGRHRAGPQHQAQPRQEGLLDSPNGREYNPKGLRVMGT